MGERRQRFNEEFKRQTVKFVQEQAKTVTDIAQELDISKSTIHQWLSKYRQFESEPVASLDKVKQLEQLLKEKEHELEKKERRIADVEEELAIVKKTVHIFSKPRT